MEQQLLGWKNEFGSGKGVHTTTSGFRGCMDSNSRPSGTTPISKRLMDYDWELTESPAGHKQWTCPALAGTVPDAHDSSITHAPTMSTADMAMKMDPIYHEPSPSGSATTPTQLADAFGSCLVQAHTPRHGPSSSLPRFRSSKRRTTLAGPGTSRHCTLSDDGRHRLVKAADHGLRCQHHRPRERRLGLSLHLPAKRHAWRSQRWSNSPRSTERMGR